MDIKTKFTPGQHVWHIHKDFVKCSRIDSLRVSVHARHDGVVVADAACYSLTIKGPLHEDYSTAPTYGERGTDVEEVYEHRIFATKAELVASL